MGSVGGSQKGFRPDHRSVFDKSHYASSVGQKVVRTLQLGPKYYLRDLPLYFAHRRRLGLSPLDVQAIYNPIFDYARSGTSRFPRPPHFLDALGAVADAGVKINLPPSRFEAVASAWWASREAIGDVIECGSYEGATALFIAALGKLTGISQVVHLLDTFMGMPTVSRYDMGRMTGEQKPGQDQVSVILAQARELGVADAVVIHQGLFADTFRSWHAAATLRFAHIDANIYSSTFEACEFVRPRVSPGGIVVFDDYNGSLDLGARLAIDHYFWRSGERVSRLAGSSSYIRIKPSAHT